MNIAEKLNTIAENEQKVYEAGKKAEYDRFWDAYQNNGDIMNGYYAFSGNAWNDKAYNPKHSIKANSFTNMFRTSNITDTKVSIDLSQGTGIYVLFDCTRLKNVPKIIVNENIVYTGWFVNCSALENITIEGTIGQNDFNVQWSTKLTHESLMSIINALKDYSADTSGTTWLITLGSENLAKLTSEEQGIARTKGWILA